MRDSSPSQPSTSDATDSRSAFLAAAGEVLGSSLDLDQTLQHVVRLAVPVLGDLCIADVVEDGRLRRVAAAHLSPEKAVLLETMRQRYPPSPDSPQPAARVMRTGEVELLEQVTPEAIATHSLDAEHARLVRAIGIRSHLAVPLVARGSLVGVISLGITE
jgi:GAF domain-containing protein